MSPPDRIVGVRCFRLGRDPWVLRSVFVDYRYDRRKVKNRDPPAEGGHELRAPKVRGPDGSRPLLDERGFYAARPDSVKEVLGRLLRAHRRAGRVQACGLVRLFGRVVEHELGYRAQGLLIDRLAVLDPDGDEEVERHLEARYGVPVDRPQGRRERARRAVSWARFWLGERWGIEVAA